MKVKIDAQLRNAAEGGAFHESEAWAQTEYGGRTVAFAAPMRVDGVCVYDGEGFTVTGEAQTVLYSVCGRCGKSFEEPFSFSFEERFERTANEDEGIYAYQGDVLDLTAMIQDNVFLHLPIRSVCSEDCKGLCPVCGCDRNIVQCDCVIEEPDESPNPLSALAALLNEDKEV
ncbi:MAG: DUF177 domain-containing protein [Clostridia bacterium]|nr:DUF177 domain-containing protein [Clostridia bacterium]